MDVEREKLRKNYDFGIKRLTVLREMNVEFSKLQ